jgi:hypothetical protein
MEADVAYRVVITCPNTGEELETGLSMSERAFENPSIEHSVANCPYCGQRHEWHIDEARLKIDDH